MSSCEPIAALTLFAESPDVCYIKSIYQPMTHGQVPSVMATTSFDVPIMLRRPMVTDRYRGLPPEVRTKIWKHVASAAIVYDLAEDGRSLEMTHWPLQSILQADQTMAEEAKPFLSLSTAYDFSRLTWPQFIRAFEDLPRGMRQEVSELIVSLRGSYRTSRGSTDDHEATLGGPILWIAKAARVPIGSNRCPSLQHVIFVFDIPACRERQKEFELCQSISWLLTRSSNVNSVRQSLDLHWHGREAPALVAMVRTGQIAKVTFSFPGASYNQMIELSQKDSIGFRVIPQHAPYKPKGIVRWGQKWYYHPHRLRVSDLGIVRLAHGPVDMNDEVSVLTDEIKATLTEISPEAADTLGIFEGSLYVCKA